MLDCQVTKFYPPSLKMSDETLCLRQQRSCDVHAEINYVSKNLLQSSSQLIVGQNHSMGSRSKIIMDLVLKVCCH